jgi:ribose-phosphate pyrophosphokinase
MKIITGSSNIDLGKKIANHLNVSLCKCLLEKFSNTEIRVEIKENIRNEDVFIVQSGGFSDEYSINDYIMECLIIIDACKRSMAKSITLICPCFPYARQDKKDESRAPISAKLLANILEKAGINRLVVMDLHASQIQGFFDIPVDNIYSFPLIDTYFKETYFKDLTLEQIQSRYVLVSPDAGAIKRTLKFAKMMKIKAVFMHKERNYQISNTVDTMFIVGDPKDIEGKTAIILDDMCDTGGTLIKCADLLKESGAIGVICGVTHGILSGPAIQRLKEADSITKMIVTNSLCHDKNESAMDKLEVVDISGLLFKVISCILSGGSISNLFKI